MQHAKKLVLVDPKFLEQLQADREYKQIQKPADALAKTSLSLDIVRILRDESMPEDKKAKLYQDALRRYTNVRSVIPEEVKVGSNPLGPVALQEPKQRKGRKRQKSPSSPAPPPLLERPKRELRTPRKHMHWLEYGK